MLPFKFQHFLTGKRHPWRVFLLYSPPGTGKSYLAGAVAAAAGATFFSVSSSDLVSKWIDEGEKIVSKLFQLARESSPAIIFVDKIDSLCRLGGEGNESEAFRRINSELLFRMQETSRNDDNVIILAATNTPHALDQAIRQRFDKLIYIPLPEANAREHMFKVKAVLFEPVRKIHDAKFFIKSSNDTWMPGAPRQPGAISITMRELTEKGLAAQIIPPPITKKDFDKVLASQRPTVSKFDLDVYGRFTEEFGEEA